MRQWRCGYSIFPTRREAEDGVIWHQQRAHKERAARDTYLAEQAELRRERDLAELKRLQALYVT